mmetsp:Transcript_23317/g.45480  ORF Transcript_23317/g.45480 Transcript_23317/m.45480 type:complete len:144 (+) Transcript_23317:159-590(+)
MTCVRTQQNVRVCVNRKLMLYRYASVGLLAVIGTGETLYSTPKQLMDLVSDFPIVSFGLVLGPVERDENITNVRKAFKFLRATQEVHWSIDILDVQIVFPDGVIVAQNKRELDMFGFHAASQDLQGTLLQRLEKSRKQFRRVV